MDQIILEVPLDSFKILKPTAFEPSFYPFAPDDYRYKKHVGVLRVRGYSPQLSIHGRPHRKRGYQYTLKIQVSVPKLLYGNNLRSVSPDDEDIFYHMLRESCKKLGIELLGNISKYKVIGFDPAINIYLTNGATAEQAIRFLHRSYTSKLVSFDQRDFRDKGHAIYLHRGKWNLVIYDKKEDLIKPKYKRMDKTQVKRQKDIYDALGTSEILRIELHGRNQTKLKKLYSQFYPDLEYVECYMLFNELHQKIVLRNYFLDELFKGNRLALSFEDGTFSWYERIRCRYSKLTDKQIRSKLALVLLARDPEGLKVYRRQFEKRHSQRQWYSLAAEIKELQTLVLPHEYFSFIHDIDKALWYRGCSDII
jgi:hypothetical protein